MALVWTMRQASILGLFIALAKSTPDILGTLCGYPAVAEDEAGLLRMMREASGLVGYGQGW